MSSSSHNACLAAAAQGQGYSGEGRVRTSAALSFSEARVTLPRTVTVLIILRRAPPAVPTVTGGIPFRTVGNV